MRQVEPALHERLAKLIAAMGYELLGAETFAQGGRKIMRLFVDSENGITLDDCAKISHQVSAMLDVEDLIQGAYNLEVSSPGINRPMFTIDQYRRYIGKQVNVRLHLPINGRRHYKGTLTRVDKENIYLLVAGMEQEVSLPFSAIEKGNLIEEIDL